VTITKDSGVDGESCHLLVAFFQTDTGTSHTVGLTGDLPAGREDLPLLHKISLEASGSCKAAHLNTTTLGHVSAQITDIRNYVSKDRTLSI
jgi:hypothetical protein